MRNERASENENKTPRSHTHTHTYHYTNTTHTHVPLHKHTHTHTHTYTRIHSTQTTHTLHTHTHTHTHTYHTYTHMHTYTHVSYTHTHTLTPAHTNTYNQRQVVHSLFPPTRTHTIKDKWGILCSRKHVGLCLCVKRKHKLTRERHTQIIHKRSLPWRAVRIFLITVSCSESNSQSKWCLLCSWKHVGFRLCVKRKHKLTRERHTQIIHKRGLPWRAGVPFSWGSESSIWKCHVQYFIHTDLRYTSIHEGSKWVGIFLYSRLKDLTRYVRKSQERAWCVLSKTPRSTQE